MNNRITVQNYLDRNQLKMVIRLFFGAVADLFAKMIDSFKQRGIFQGACVNSLKAHHGNHLLHYIFSGISGPQ